MSAAREEQRGHVVVFGEAMLRLAHAEGRRLEEPGNLTCDVAGSEVNVGYALARLGVPVTWLGALPDSPLGRRVEHELRAAGVDLRPVARFPGARIGVLYAEIGAGARSGRVWYDRAGSAFTLLNEVDLSAIEGAWAVVVSGITPALGGHSAELALAVAGAADTCGAKLCVDVNYRSLLWKPATARATLAELLATAAIAICSASDASAVFDLEGPPEDVARSFAENWAPRAELVVITRGDLGCTYVAGTEVGTQSAFPTEVVDPFGVGDAFTAGLLWELLRSSDPAQAVRVASIVAAIKCTIRGDLARIVPTEVEAALAGASEALLR